MSRIVVSDHEHDGQTGLCKQCLDITGVGSFFGVILCSQRLNEVYIDLYLHLHDSDS